jgi:ankyrin repeat protein
MEAALHGRLVGVRALLAADADVNAAAEDGSTALMHACYRRPVVEVIALLIDHGAWVNAARTDGYTALMSAARNGTAATVELFWACGADIAAVDGTGRDALAHATDAGNADTAKILRAVGPTNER